MERYKSILTQEIVSVCIVAVLLLIATIALIIAIFKFHLHNTLLLIAAACISITIFAGKYIFDCIQDINTSSYVEYDGTYSYRGRDTVILNDSTATKLNASFHHPSDATLEGIIIYSKRSKIIVNSKSSNE